MIIPIFLYIIGGCFVVIGRITNGIMDGWMIEIGTDNSYWHRCKNVFLIFWTSGWMIVAVAIVFHFIWQFDPVNFIISLLINLLILILQWRLFEFALKKAREMYRLHDEKLN